MAMSPIEPVCDQFRLVSRAAESIVSGIGPAMSDSSRVDRARRILGWLNRHTPWAGSWDFYETPPFEGEMTAVQVNDPLLLAPLVTPIEVTPIFPGIALACVVQASLLPPTKHHTEAGEPLYPREDVYRCLDVLLNSEAFVSAEVCAKFLDISPSSLRDYSNRGLIPFAQIGKHKKYQLRKVMQKLEHDFQASAGKVEALKHLLR